MTYIGTNDLGIKALINAIGRVFYDVPLLAPAAQRYEKMASGLLAHYHGLKRRDSKSFMLRMLRETAREVGSKLDTEVQARMFPEDQIRTSAGAMNEWINRLVRDEIKVHKNEFSGRSSDFAHHDVVIPHAEKFFGEISIHETRTLKGMIESYYMRVIGMIKLRAHLKYHGARVHQFLHVSDRSQMDDIKIFVRDYSVVIPATPESKPIIMVRQLDKLPSERQAWAARAQELGYDVIELPNYRIDGGDVVIDRTRSIIYVGYDDPARAESMYTDKAMVDVLKSHPRLRQWKIEPIEKSHACRDLYHLDTFFGVTAKGVAVLCAEGAIAQHASNLEAIYESEMIKVCPHVCRLTYPTNFLSAGSTVITTGLASELEDQLKSRGHRIVTIGHLAKYKEWDAGIHCLTQEIGRS